MSVLRCDGHGFIILYERNQSVKKPIRHHRMGFFAPSFFHNDVADLFISLNVKVLLNMPENLVFRARISFMEDIMDSSIFSYIVF